MAGQTLGIAALQKHIDLTFSGEMNPLIHIRQEVEEVNDIVELYSGTVVMHLFTGTLMQLKKSVSNRNR